MTYWQCSIILALLREEQYNEMAKDTKAAVAGTCVHDLLCDKLQPAGTPCDGRLSPDHFTAG